YTIASFIKHHRDHNDPEYTYVAKVRTEQGGTVTHLFREPELSNRAETVPILKEYDAYCNTYPPPFPTTYSKWLKSQHHIHQADFVDFKKTHSIEGTWGVPLKVIRPFLYHLAGFGLKFVRALDDQRVAVEVVSPSLLIQKLVMSLGMIDLILGMKDLILGVTTNVDCM
ncbi:hypothetical protein DYB28_015863, partial [Aphanomyces astaci]